MVLATHSIRQFPLHFTSLRHRVPSHFNWTLPLLPLRALRPVQCLSVKTQDVTAILFDHKYM